MFQLKEAVGTDLIREREHDFIQRAIASWSTHPNLRILGHKEAPRLSIVSFVVRHGARYLHHNFVVALLNDLFGIQTRGGCSCAGPYGHRLLGIDLSTSRKFEQEILRGCEGIKPGWVRVNFNYFISETTFEFLLRAVRLVAEEGWKMLPQYRFFPLTGEWQHRRGHPAPAMGLSDVNYRSGKMEYRSRRATEPESALEIYFEEAQRIFAEAGERHDLQPAEIERQSAGFESLRWFPLPKDIVGELEGLPEPSPAPDLLHF